MKQTELEKLYAEALPNMRAALGLTGWRIHVSYGTCCSNPEAAGECLANPDYRIARMRFNPDEIHTEDACCATPEGMTERHAALDVLRHELLHIVIAATNQHHDVVESALGMLGPAAVEAVAASKCSTDERLILSIERALGACGQTAEVMARSRG